MYLFYLEITLARPVQIEIQYCMSTAAQNTNTSNIHPGTLFFLTVTLLCSLLCWITTYITAKHSVAYLGAFHTQYKPNLKAFEKVDCDFEK